MPIPTVEERVEELKPKVTVSPEDAVKWNNAARVLQSALDAWYKSFEPSLRTTLTTDRQAFEEATIKAVIDAHYELEEWFANHSDMTPEFWEAHQQTMKTRNKITATIKSIYRSSTKP